MNAFGTWHHGLVAEWWAEFNTDGPEIDYFGRFVERAQPALDAGCGTGRLLVPWLRAGYDVDGADVSADMIAHCAARARAEGFEPTLLVQALHELDPPRRYRTVVACGVLGIGTTRAQDQEGLDRIRACLEPGGTLLVDNEVPYSNPRRLALWAKKGRGELPAPWPESGTRKRAASGAEYGLRSRVVSVDPLDQSEILELRAEKWVDGDLVASEDRTISLRSLFRDEIVMMLERAGFAEVEVRGGYDDDEPTADHAFLVYLART
ncbi:MAG TPA: class I SAM-dependent methyltransferase [Gaiellaceae bacterium]|nr:class I SAM-dependent methyltransferase [Gaiellaceae bacterium]